jgi:O-antigen/teichoic acid export membrane protein
MLKLFINFSYGSWISAAISFFTTPIITALIIPDEFGKSAMFTLAIGFFMQIVQLGSDQSFVRFFYDKPENKRNRLFWTCLYIPLILTTIFSLSILLFWKAISNYLFETSDFTAVLLLSICLYLSVAERFTTLVVRMKQRGNLFSIIKVINSVVNVLVIIFYVYNVAYDFHAILFGTIISLFVSIIISIITERKWFNIKISLDKNEIKPILLYGIPFVPIFIISWVFQGMAKIALRSWSTYEEIGLFSTALKVTAPLTILQTGFLSFWVPLAMQKYNQNNADTKFFEDVFNNLSFFLFFLSVGLILIKDILILFFAPSYRVVSQIMPFLVFIPLLYSLAEITGLGISFKKKTYLGLVVSSISAIVNLIGNYFLVPLYGAKGAAVSTCIAYLFLFILRTLFSIRLFPMKLQINKFLLSLCVLIVMAYINTFFLSLWYLNLIFLIIVSVIYNNELISNIKYLFTKTAEKK